MLSRRRFLAHTSVLASTTALAEALFAPVAAGTAFEPAPDSKLLDRAKALLERAPLIDTHNDLPKMLLTTRSDDLSKLDLGKVQPTLCADIPRLREGRVGAQYWSIEVDDSTQSTHMALHDALRQFDVTLRLIRSRPELALARTADDIERIHRSRTGGPLFDSHPLGQRPVG
jgi:membrane dipeptidase